jgi:predicted dinucleotide-binding enzyme
MKIGIIGSGNVGSALGKSWQKAGHQVVFRVRNPESFKAKSTNADDQSGTVRHISTAITQSNVVVIATPPEAVHELIPFLKEADDKVVIDTTNAFRTKPEGYPTAYHALQALTNCRHLAKCFNSTGFENMADPLYHLSEPVVHDMQLDMFMATDSDEARKICRELAQDLGFEHCYDFGGSDKVELLEQFALSWINLAIMQKQGRAIGFKVLRREG